MNLLALSSSIGAAAGKVPGTCKEELNCLAGGVAFSQTVVLAEAIILKTQQITSKTH